MLGPPSGKQATSPNPFSRGGEGEPDSEPLSFRERGRGEGGGSRQMDSNFHGVLLEKTPEPELDLVWRCFLIRKIDENGPF